MTQQAPAQLTVREDERVLPITYERALAMAPRIAREATGSELEELGDGYFVTKETKGTSRREVTLRLGRQGADTRLSVRVESFTDPWVATFIVLMAIVTLGIGVLALIPWIQSNQRRAARERDLLVHKTFRAFEDAVAEQGVAKGYRIAPGADANEPGHAEEEEQAAEESQEEQARAAR